MRQFVQTHARKRKRAAAIREVALTSKVSACDFGA
jgi:hypothetical protein